MATLEFAIEQIKFARSYSTELIESFDESEWFIIPEGGVTHLGWQVGHLAMAMYGLTLIRTRGKEPTDAEFISNAFFRTFKKGTTPVADATAYPTPAEIRSVFDGVYQQALKEMPGFDQDALLDNLPAPTAVYDNKLGSLLFCSAHELIHSGQIGVLRRMLGKDPIR